MVWSPGTCLVLAASHDIELCSQCSSVYLHPTLELLAIISVPANIHETSLHWEVCKVWDKSGWVTFYSCEKVIKTNITHTQHPWPGLYITLSLVLPSLDHFNYYRRWGWEFICWLCQRAGGGVRSLFVTVYPRAGGEIGSLFVAVRPQFVDDVKVTT